MAEGQITGTVSLGGVRYDLTGQLKPPATVAAIIAAAGQPNGPPYPLPLAGSWNTGTVANSYDPAYQLAQIQSGRHLLPWFQFPEPDAPLNTPALAYYQAALTACRDQGLPLVFVGTQWEQRLYQDAKYKNLPAAQNPNVVLADGTVRSQLSPFGPREPWYQVGFEWTAAPLLQQLIAWYPNPPRVVFLSNNEALRLSWTAATDEPRYTRIYGTGQTPEAKRQVVGDGWIGLYRELQQGMCANLTTAWREVTEFRGYDAFGPPFLGRWPGWHDYALDCPGRLDPAPLLWDGGAPSYYTSPGTGITDYQVMSPQLEAMNWVPMQAEAVKLNPTFAFELSVWDGGDAQRQAYAAAGQTYTPERYAGFVQWGLWLLRPRVVREFRYAYETRATTESYFQALVAGVDRVHLNADLSRFWRDGVLVANAARQHPYQTALSAEQQALPRWYGLDTSADPPRPWALTAPLPVRALALTLGTAPTREWLLYAHAPLGGRTNVKVTLPLGGAAVRTVTLDVPVEGRFFRLAEAGGQPPKII